MRKIWMLIASVLLCFCGGGACGLAAQDPEEWRSCPAVGRGLSERVDECFKEVNAYFPTTIDEKGDFYTLWNDFKICDVFAGGSGKQVSAETMEQLRECGGWIVSHDCQQVGEKLHLLLIKRAMDAEQPPVCNLLFGQLRGNF